MPRPHLLRRGVAAATAVTIVAGAAVVGLAAPASATTASVEFTTAGAHQFVVPAGVQSIHVEALGGSGAQYYFAENRGGAGGFVTADLPVTGGQAFTAVVGGNGSGATGGYNGGGAGGVIEYSNGAGGGGATDLRSAPDDLASRVLVAAGGGGGQSEALGGDAGAPGNSRGCDIDTMARPGTDSAGGAGGVCGGYGRGTDGTLGQGGDGGTDAGAGATGAGGGGGLYGGGGGSPWGSGAGGSSFVTPTALGSTVGIGAYLASPYLRISYTRSPLNGISLQVSPSRLTADGTSTTVATARLTNAAGTPATGEDVKFTSSAGNSFGPVSDRGNGLYTATMTATTKATTVAVTAQVFDGRYGYAATVYVSQDAGPTKALAVTVSPGTLPADGTSTAVLEVRTTDQYGNPSASGIPTLVSDSGNAVSTPTAAGQGVWRATVRATTTAGPVRITATDRASSATGVATFTQVAGAATSVTPAVSVQTVPADGTSDPVEVVTTVVDANGNPVVGARPTLTSSDPESVVGSSEDNSDGTYTTLVTPSRTLGTVTLTASVGTASGTVKFRQVPGAPARVRITSQPVTVVADGRTSTPVSATVEDAAGHPLADVPVSWSTDDSEQRITGEREVGDGTYTAVVRASTTVGTSTLSVTAPTASGRSTDTQPVEQTVGAPATVTVTAAPDRINADGTSTTVLDATVTDAWGHPVDGRSPALSASDPRVTFSSVRATGPGTYRSTMTSSTTAGTVTVRVTDEDASGSVTVDQEAGAPTDLRLVVGTPVDQGDGTFRTVVTAIVTDAFGNVVAAQRPTFRLADRRATLSALRQLDDGTVEVSVTAPAGVDTTVTASLGSIDATTEVPAGTEVAPPAAGLPTEPVAPTPIATPGAPRTADAPAVEHRTTPSAREGLAYTGASGLAGTGVLAFLAIALGLVLRAARRRHSV